MATILNTGNTAAPGCEGGLLPPDPSCRPCPDCGGLECLCRPRFFAGQLLSEQDLNRLDHYIVEKHKLHNRHLFGAGVVCGLEVRCAPCDNGFVSVSGGYALSPCGEDIVVCKPDTVDICKLIARCRTDKEPDCSPWQTQAECGDIIEDWILAIRYAESPSRGITPLTGGQGCGCSCGTSCSGNCGCNGGPTCSCGTAKGLREPEPLRQPRLNRNAPPSCEPTLTCETYRYDVFRAPVEPPRDPQGEQSGFSGFFGQLEGEMMARIACCIKQLEDMLPPIPGDIEQPIPPNQQNAWFQWGCLMRTALANYFARHGGHNCEAIAQLQTIVIPSPNQPPASFHAAMQTAFMLLLLLVFEALLACICSNALPPCPAPGDPRVPLAAIKVRRRDCRVISVCNWHPLRKHVLTFPTLTYWTGFLPFGRIIREAMHKLCCGTFKLPDFNIRDSAIPGAAAIENPNNAMFANMAAASPAGPTGFSFSDVVFIDPMAGAHINSGLFEAIARRQGDSKGVTTWGDLAAGMRRSNVRIDPNLQGKDRDDAIARVAATGPVALMSAIFGSLGPLAENIPLGRGMARATDDGGSRELAEMRARLDAQAQEIELLKAAMRNNGPG